MSLRWKRKKPIQPPSYVNVSTAKITLALAIQVIYELSLANDFHTGLYTVSSPLSLHTVKKKIHRINVPENIAIIKSVSSSRMPPKTFPLFTQISTINLQERTRCFNSLPPTARQWASVQRGCVQEPQTDGDSCVVTVALARLETDMGGNGSQTMTLRYEKKKRITLRFLFQPREKEAALSLFTDLPKTPNFFFAKLCAGH